MVDYDVIVVGAGAAGMMCAIEAGKRGRRVLVVDHVRRRREDPHFRRRPLQFHQYPLTPANFLSNNPHYAKSALARFTPADFVKMVENHGIAYHEKTLGQLFCDVSAKQIVNMLLAEMLGAECGRK